MNQPIDAVSQWLQKIVIGLNFCPFAKTEFLRQRVRLVESMATCEAQLLNDLGSELSYLESHPEVETTVLIHPSVLQDFHHYNQFLDTADAQLERHNLVGEIQIASFHPNYQFAGTHYAAAENYTNRSPYPLLHLLREDSLEAAIRRHPNTDAIPQANIALAERLGADHLQQLLADCLHEQT